ncbi:MAG: hypothetical protein ACKVPX_07625, partial [Myxococcaceae bacterium]
TGLPRAKTLYGPLADQLKDANSFASKLKAMLAVRERYRIHESEQLDIPVPRAKGLLVMAHKLPGDGVHGGGVQVTALNFGQTSIDETVSVSAVKAGQGVTELLTQASEGKVATGGQVRVRLAPLEAKALLFK